jgi:16S rRNA processing protein RimM
VSSDAQPLVVVARVVKAHGIRGEVACDLLTDVPDRLGPGARLVLGDRPVTVAGSRPHQGRMLVRFEGVADRNEAELLRGLELKAEPLAPEEQDVYFVHELVGMRVLADDGTVLGAVRAVVELPAAAEYDLLEVERDDGSRWLLPAVDDYVEVAVDDADVEHLVVVDPPEGLLDEAGASPADPDGEPDA